MKEIHLFFYTNRLQLFLEFLVRDLTLTLFLGNIVSMACAEHARNAHCAEEHC